MDKEKAVVELKEVSKKYGRNLVLDNISLSIDSGEFVILIGPSGAGKSTLIRLLIREERPNKGKIMISGRDITRLRDYELPYYRRNVGIVFQDFKLLPNKTVYENVAYALEVSDEPDSEIERKIPRILKAVGLSEKSKAFPEQLSGGEKQRVSIARALVHNPKFLIADEPTGNLDPESTREIADLLEKINCQGTIVLLATHNKELVDRMRKRVITMKAGKIISDEARGRYICK